MLNTFYHISTHAVLKCFPYVLVVQKCCFNTLKCVYSVLLLECGILVSTCVHHFPITLTKNNTVYCMTRVLGTSGTQSPMVTTVGAPLQPASCRSDQMNHCGQVARYNGWYFIVPQPHVARSKRQSTTTGFSTLRTLDKYSCRRLVELSIIFSSLKWKSRGDDCLIVTRGTKVCHL